MRRVMFSALFLSALLAADAIGNDARLGSVFGFEMSTIKNNVNRAVLDVAWAVRRRV